MQRFLELAIEQALKSEMYFQHGAVLFTGNHSIDMGYNRIDRSKWQKMTKMYSTHAEIDCSRRLLCAPTQQIQA